MKTETKVIIAGASLATLLGGWYLYNRYQQNQQATTAPGTAPAGGGGSILDTFKDVAQNVVQNLVDKFGNVFIHTNESDGLGNRAVLVNLKKNGAFATLKKGADGLMYGQTAKGESWRYDGSGYWSSVPAMGRLGFVDLRN